MTVSTAPIRLISVDELGNWAWICRECGKSQHHCPSCWWSPGDNPWDAARDLGLAHLASGHELKSTPELMSLIEEHRG